MKIKKKNNDIDDNTLYSKSEKNIEQFEENSNYGEKADDNYSQSIDESQPVSDYDKINEVKDIKNIKLNRKDYFDIFKCCMKIRYNSHQFFNYISNKIKISLSNVKELKIIGNGNCFYKCLAKFLYGKFEYDERLRKGVVTFCKDNIDEIYNYKNKVELDNGDSIDTKEYINEIEKENTDVDIMVSCYMFDINVVFKYSNNKNSIQCTDCFLYEDNYNSPTMALLNENFNHFNLLYPYIAKNNIINEMDKKKVYKDNTELNPYPRYLGKDKNLYLNIFNFLNDGIINGKRKWPDYIDYILDKIFRDRKKIRIL